MIDFAAAYQQVMQHQPEYGIETVTLAESLGRVLAEDWVADRPFPPYDRVTMDGIAFSHKQSPFPQRLHNQGIAAAGTPQQALQTPNHCLEVMTGAILPKGCDTVIRYEDLRIKGTEVQLPSDYIPFRNIHRQGEDRAMGSVLVEQGTTISATTIGVGASIGKAIVKVYRQPRILVISTGDELVPIDTKPAAHQIRRSNSYSIVSALQTMGISATMAHLNDNLAGLRTQLAQHLADYDVLVCSGGVSKGKFDYLPQVLDELGVHKSFHRVTQRPGKPFWFGMDTQRKCTVFALPGNPVSSFMCTQVYLRSWLQEVTKSKPHPQPTAILTEAVSFKPDLTYFLNVRLTYNQEGQLLAEPLRGNGSGDLVGLSQANGFVQLQRGQTEYPAGTVVKAWLF